MPSIRSFLLAFLFASRISASAIQPKGAVDSAEDERQADEGAFQELLAKVDPSALHAALHDLSPAKFKHGAYHQDSVAAKAIHRDDPALGTSIIELARRQTPDNSSTLTTPTSDPATSSVIASLLVPSSPSPSSTISSLPTSTFAVTTMPTDTSTPSPSTSVVVVTPTQSPTVVIITTGPTSSPSTIPTSEPPSSVVPTSAGGSPTPSIPATPATSEPPTSIPTSAESSEAGPAPSSTGESPSSGAPGENTSSAQAPDTTSSPDSGAGGGITSLFLETTTLPNGAISIVSLTSYVAGAAPTAGPAGGSTNPSTTSPEGSLQSENAAAGLNIWSWHIAGVLGGALGAFIAF